MNIRALRKTGKIIAWVMGTLALIVVVALLSINLPPVRAALVRKANAALAGSLRGKLVVERLGHTGWSGVDGVDAKIYDPRGRRVLDVRGLSVRFGVLDLARQAVFGSAPLDVRIARVGVAHVDMGLFDDGSGSPTLASAFEPRAPGPPSSKPGPTIRIESVEVGHLWVHGALPSAPVIDAEFGSLDGTIEKSTTAIDVSVETLRVQSRGLPRAVNPSGTITGRAHVGNGPKDIDVDASFIGEVASIPTTLTSSFHHGVVRANLTAPNASPEALRALAPGLSPKSSLDLAVEAEGALPEVDVRVFVAGGAGSVSMTGHASLRQDTLLDASLDVRDFDASELVSTAPRTRLGLTADTHARIAHDGAITADYHLVAPAAAALGQATPAVLIDGDFLDDPAGKGMRADGITDIAEPGARTRIHYTFRDTGRGAAVEFASATDLRRPPRLARLTDIAITGTLNVRARWELDTSNVAGSLLLAATDVTQGHNRVGKLAVRADMYGTLPNPCLDASVDADGLTLESYAFSHIHATARGDAERLDLEGTLTGDHPKQTSFSATVLLGPVPAIEDARVVASDGETRVTIDAPSVRLGERIAVRDATLVGAGSARLSLTLGARLEQLSIATAGLDLPRLLRLAGVRSPLRTGKLTLDAEYSALRGDPIGHARGTFETVVVDDIENARMDIEMNLRDGLASGQIDARLGAGGRARATLTDLTIGQELRDRAAIDRVAGKVELTSDLDLGHLRQLTRLEAFPFARMRGRVALDVRVERRAGSRDIPELVARLRTRSVELAMKRQRERPIRTEPVARAEEPWSFYGIDFDANASLTGDDGALTASVRASDKAGEIGHIDFSSKLPHESLAQLVSFGPRARELPFEATVVVPGHALETLPPLIRPSDTAGTVALEARASGTFAEPKVTLSGQVLRYRPSDMRGAGLDLMVKALYEPNHGEISAEAHDGGGKGEMQARWEGPIVGLARALDASQPSPIRGEARIAFDRLPIGDVPQVALQEIRGRATGEVRIDGFGRDARVDARIDVADLRIAQAKPMQLRARCTTSDNGQLQGTLAIGVPGGSANGEVRAGYAWGDRIAPTIALPVEGRFQARRFQLAGLLPLVRGAVSELDGKLDANITGRFGGGPPVLAGTAKVDEGVVRIPAIGQRLHGIVARASLEHGDARVDELVASGTSGKVKATARARFDGLALRTAEAHLSIAKRDKIPVTTEGAEVGDAWGKVDATLVNDTQATRIDVRVRELHVLLPQDASHEVQDLAPPEFIRTGVVRPDGNFVVVPVQPLEREKTGPTRPTLITIKLQDKVWIERANQARVQLTGQLTVTSDTEARINGEIRLKGGTLDVQGKEFEIERGTVTFTGDASNPEIVATAVWKSEVDYRVYADYTGTIKKGKLSLRADPPLTQDQILSLILFGNPDGAMGTGSGDPAATAIGVAGGTATQGLNRMLADFTQLDVTARIDTSSGSARPELVLRVTPRVSARLSQALGEPAPGEPPDRTFLTLGARIGGRWSVDTTVGDKGASAVDFNWRLRY